MAAKAALDAEVKSVTSLGVNYASPLAPGSGIGNPGAPLSSEDAAAAYGKVATYLQMFGKLPEHVERDLWERSRYVGALDPDIAVKRSWSMSVKIGEQRRRNYERELERIKNMGWYEQAQSRFAKIAGFRWPF